VRGPSASLALPIFNQGQGAVARAEAELLRARAERDARTLAVSNDVRLGLDALNVAHLIAERYRSELLPQREAILARTQERVNFMLVGVFELLLAKQQEYDAYQAYLEAVRDYWIARAELRGAAGGRLPDDDETAEPTIGVEAVPPRSEPVEMDHSGHARETSDPHAGHRMPAKPETREVDRPDDDDADAAPHHSHDHGDTP
jgi:cobalt-zinc-cadmium efflux system outer membrane protein